MQKGRFKFILMLFSISLLGCNSPVSEQKTVHKGPLFTLLPSNETHIKFNNHLTEGLNTNVMMYEYFYNGGGVAIGDINNDNLEDIYFSGNMCPNKLYLNKGGMAFEDITLPAGVEGREGPWKTGVSMVDINGDGLLDIYLCYSGKINGKKRINQLFVNKGKNEQGIPYFEEEAALFGLADSSFTTQAVFFDFDKDNDLDALLINHNPNRINIIDDNFIAKIQQHPHSSIGVKLLQNNKGYFTDISQKAGLQNTALSYGLGAGVADVNQDGWPDLYLSHDYDVPDYLYINNGDGTFTDKLAESLGHISHFSMGNDIADFNNDGLPDILSLDMLPETNHRQKVLFLADNYNAFNLRLRAGFHYQYMRNMLQLNNGNGTFSEIGQLSGISNTDWSWAPLFADFDNDGWKDLLITNGFVRDFTNLDFSKYAGNHLQKKQEVFRKDLLALVYKMPSSNVENYIFKNNRDLTFSNVTASWGLNLPSNSNGAAYADLDNDGDLDLVVNNINKEAFIYRNEANVQQNNHYLNLRLKGDGLNTSGLGAKVSLFRKGKQQYLEQMPIRGYQSGVSPILHFGLGEDVSVDSLIIKWPNGKQQVLRNIEGDTLISLNIREAGPSTPSTPTVHPVFKSIKPPFSFQDPQNAIIDFNRQPLLVNPLSFSGPCLAKGDVNKDGLEDIYAGGGMGKSATLYIQQKDKTFQKRAVPAFGKDKESEDADALFFDSNNDGLTDIYVCSGGYHHYLPDDPLLEDRIYLNDGNGNFSRDLSALPKMYTSTSCVRANDINNDGYLDLFVGGRVIPGRYPEAPTSYILINDGKGHFKDMTSSIAPTLKNIGMVTDATWIDLNNDGEKELVVVGEWMPVTVFVNQKGLLKNKTLAFFDHQYAGWWNKILTGDFNHDNKTDLIIGNLGVNSQCRVSNNEPATVYFDDFDKNGSLDPIFCFYIQGKSYPSLSRDELLNQLSAQRKHFKTYESYADATIDDLFTKEVLKKAGRLEANLLSTTYFQSTTDGKFIKKELPLQVQFSPVFTINVLDFNEDGNEDLLLCGNMLQARLRFGRYDANYGFLLKGNGNGDFQYISQKESGLSVKGDVRSVINIGSRWLFGINQKEMVSYKMTTDKPPQNDRE